MLVCQASLQAGSIYGLVCVAVLTDLKQPLKLSSEFPTCVCLNQKICMCNPFQI